METHTTLVKGLAFDIIIIETVQQDASGHLFYKAEIRLKNRRGGAQRLLRKTRIPGAASDLRAAVQRQGIRALEALVSAS